MTSKYTNLKLHKIDPWAHSFPRFLWINSNVNTCCPTILFHPASSIGIRIRRWYPVSLERPRSASEGIPVVSQQTVPFYYVNGGNWGLRDECLRPKPTVAIGLGSSGKRQLLTFLLMSPRFASCPTSWPLLITSSIAFSFHLDEPPRFSWRDCHPKISSRF